ncbi:hypothetical protein PC9H_002400 [Pleurotus ostreatus]|uniref:Peptidase M48 domain-containing protein n=1 Tax=Pleurotus ostreatus TaxID=5322 RepID=A0A8H6ZLI6_PLEOS|nr:uncharacterized protein PC9H_002400 [Pleurotus ostreatus]KAF7416138.1 hypothetical protein PC9H_002400 [Pleurotus ostreatus]
MFGASVRLFREATQTSGRTICTRRSFSSTFRPRNQYVRFGESGSGPKSPRRRTQWDGTLKVVVVGLGLSTAYYVAHLEQVPETGRWRFIDVGPDLEASVGRAASAELHAEYQARILPPNHRLTLQVQGIVQRILTASNLGKVKSSYPQAHFAPPTNQNNDSIWSGNDDAYGVVASEERDVDRVAQRDWEVVVINDQKIVNAAASPGLVYVFTGMLPISQDESGLAAVLSHEIGHVVARHVPERISSQKVLFVIASLLQYVGVDFGISRLFTTFLLDLPNTRAQEKEADVIGLRLMSKACYDPSAAPRVFSRLAEFESKSQRVRLEFLQTHPLTERRVEYLEAMLPEAYAIIAGNPECSIMQQRLDEFRSASAFRVPL